jgi:hypothetical protein
LTKWAERQDKCFLEKGTASKFLRDNEVFFWYGIYLVVKTMASMKCGIEGGGKSRKAEVLICQLCHALEFSKVGDLKFTVVEYKEELLERRLFFIIVAFEVYNIADWNLTSISQNPFLTIG